MDIEKGIKEIIVLAFVFIVLLFIYIGLEMWALGGIDNVPELGWINIVNSLLLLFPAIYIRSWILDKDD